MSVLKRFVIVCSGIGADRRPCLRVAPDEMQETIKAARAVARKHGWLCPANTLDLCPDCRMEQ